ncbi:protein BTG1-like [Watersipora subatra]|uniref:protein BTG1-like n=1 Tax=Watersipora subatra TaxID=2589382 RepID=UPI00355C4546
MREEVNAAVGFLTKLMRSKLNKECVEQFQCTLKALLQNHYQDHWFPELPHRGSGYRCIRINAQVMDPIVDVAVKESGIATDCSVGLFPDELTMWIDPSDVSYRIGESGSIGQIELRSGDQSQKRSPSILESRKILPSCKEQFTRGISHATQGYSINTLGLRPYAAFAS